MATVDKKVINISKDSEYAIGRMLVRGYSNGEAFHSKLLDTKVGNVRNAISYLSREGMTKEMLAKTKLTKKDMAKVVDFPKKRVDGYNAKLKSICADRILAEKKLMMELIKFLDKETGKIAIVFVAKDKDNKNHMSMERYTKVLNQLMCSDEFIKSIKEKTFVKPKPKMEAVKKTIDAKSNKVIKSFTKSSVPKAKSGVVVPTRKPKGKNSGY